MEERSKFKRERKYPRFLIPNSDIMRGAIGPLSDSYRLLTFGEGGAGFMALKGSKVLSPPIDVTCTFECRRLQMEPFTLSAYLLYSFESYELRGERGVFYGVEFKVKTQDTVTGCIRILEDLASKRLVEIETKDL